jgi:hypothetical protein
VSNETLYQAAVKSAQQSLETREIKQGKVRALLGDVVGNLTGPSGVPWVLARLYGDASRRVEAYNGTPLVPTFNLAVELWVRYENGRATRYDIKGIDTGVPYAGGYTPGGSGGLAAHHLSHEGTPGGGWDLVNIYPLNMTFMRPDPQATPDLTVQVAGGFWWASGTLVYFTGGNSPAFTPPGSGLRYDVLTLDAAGSLNIQVGALTTPPVTFVLPTDELPIVAVLLSAGQTTIQRTDMYDVRPFLSIGGSGTSSGILLDSDGIPILDSDGNLIYSN